jgi:RHS repeat-associated protein
MGEIYEYLEYTPYGELWVEHVPVVEPTPFRFTGKERDSETGLYYYGARYLNPQTGMWLSADPAMGEYIPLAPIDDKAKQHNQNLPGMGACLTT